MRGRGAAALDFCLRCPALYADDASRIPIRFVGTKHDGSAAGTAQLGKSNYRGASLSVHPPRSAALDDALEPAYWSWPPDAVSELSRIRADAKQSWLAQSSSRA
jgi:hypothetical protein